MFCTKCCIKVENNDNTDSTCMNQSTKLFCYVAICVVINVFLYYLIISTTHSVIIVLEYTLLGLLLNADYILPLISFFTIVTIYITKSCQSFCEVYSSLLINVNAVSQGNKGYESTWRVPKKEYELVRKNIEPYPKNLLILVVESSFHCNVCSADLSSHRFFKGSR